MVLSDFYSLANKDIKNREFTDAQFVIAAITRVRNFYLLELAQVEPSELGGLEAKSVIKAIWKPASQAGESCAKLEIGCAVSVTGKVVISPTQGFTIMATSVVPLQEVLPSLNDKSVEVESSTIPKSLDLSKVTRVVVVSHDGGGLHGEFEDVALLLNAFGLESKFVPYNYRKENKDEQSTFIEELKSLKAGDLLYFDLVDVGVVDSFVLNKNAVLSAISELEAPVVVSPFSSAFTTSIASLSTGRLTFANLMVSLCIGGKTTPNRPTVETAWHGEQWKGLVREIRNDLMVLVNKSLAELARRECQYEGTALPFGDVVEIREALLSNLDETVSHVGDSVTPCKDEEMSFSLGAIRELRLELSDFVFKSLIESQRKEGDSNESVESIENLVLKQRVAINRTLLDECVRQESGKVTDVYSVDTGERIKVEDLVKGDEVTLLSDGVRTVIIEGIKK